MSKEMLVVRFFATKAQIKHILEINLLIINRKQSIVDETQVLTESEKKLERMPKNGYEI
jgi:hypothetical protein